MPKFTLDTPEVQNLLKDTYRCSKQTYFKISETGEPYVVPIRRELMALFHISAKSATALLADIPYAEFISNKQKQPEAVAAEPATPLKKTGPKPISDEERKERRARLEIAENSKKYALIRRGEYWGSLNEWDMTTVLFRSKDEAVDFINEQIHGRDVFRSFHGARCYKSKQPELQEAHFGK